MAVQMVAAVALTAAALSVPGVALLLLAPTRGAVRLPLVDGACRLRGCSNGYHLPRALGAAFLAALVFACDRHVAEEAAIAWPRMLGYLENAGAAGAIQAFVPSGVMDAAALGWPALATASVLAVISWRCRAASPLIMLVVAAAILALAIDGLAPTRSLTADSLATLIDAAALLQALCVAGGIALSPRLSAGAIGAAMVFAAAAVLHRIAAALLSTMAWDTLADTGRLVFAFTVVVLPATVLALCALVGPSVHIARSKAAGNGLEQGT